MILRKASWAAAAVILTVPCAVLAANATHPYSNIDRRVDAGNDTGDSRVDQLNQAQLGQAQILPRRRVRPFASPYQQRYGAPAYGRAYGPGAGYGSVYYPPPPAFYPPPGYSPPY